MLDHLKLTGVAHSTKFMDILQKFFERNDLVFTSVEHWTNKDGDEMIQLRWQKVKETNGTVERDVDHNKSETNGEKCANGGEDLLVTETCAYEIVSHVLLHLAERLKSRWSL